MELTPPPPHTSLKSNTWNHFDRLVIRPSTFHSLTQLSDSTRLPIMYLFMYCHVNFKLCLTKTLTVTVGYTYFEVTSP